MKRPYLHRDPPHLSGRTERRRSGLFGLLLAGGIEVDEVLAAARTAGDPQGDHRADAFGVQFVLEYVRLDRDGVLRQERVFELAEG